MNLTDQVMATKEGFVDFIKNYPADTPVVMLNILKFKAKSGNGDETGKQSYNAYGAAVDPLLKKVGGRVIWAGKVNKTVIGDYTDEPHRILVVEYPSKQAFIDMSTSEEYAKISHLRELALEYGGLIATETIGFG
ncbi:MAG: DUF1330 domain-containing protein [Saprospiraceae bacterium]|nr:DUF1330 domain-containing protein [Saprospiraceae bacterium]|tara:strand:- start:281 stop:685 length:405 start_codon:yes stop_codon:yes gene_type:complete